MKLDFFRFSFHLQKKYNTRTCQGYNKLRFALVLTEPCIVLAKANERKNEKKLEILALFLGLQHRRAQKFSCHSVESA